MSSGNLPNPLSIYLSRLLWVAVLARVWRLAWKGIRGLPGGFGLVHQRGKIGELGPQLIGHDPPLCANRLPQELRSICLLGLMGILFSQHQQ